MAKVLMSKVGKIMTTKNNTPAKGAANIGPLSRTGSRSGDTGSRIKGQAAPTSMFSPSTMPNRAAPMKAANPVKSNAGHSKTPLPKARGAMAKFS